MHSNQRYAPAAARNADAITHALAQLLPKDGSVLEVASGTGQHVARFAQRFPHIDWYPSDLDPQNVASISTYVEDADCSNLRAPLVFDIENGAWTFGDVSVILAINLVHIAPWSTAQALFSRAGERLLSDGQLILYGPYRFFGVFGAASNQRFEDALIAQDPSWGVRDLAELGSLASKNGLYLNAVLPMPANNHILQFRRPKHTSVL